MRESARTFWVMAYLGAVHYWWPKIFGRTYPERWGAPVPDPGASNDRPFAIRPQPARRLWCVALPARPCSGLKDSARRLVIRGDQPGDRVRQDIADRVFFHEPERPAQDCQGFLGRGAVLAADPPDSFRIGLFHKGGVRK